MAEPKLAERRVTQRQRALKSATVIFDDRASTLNCVVRNYSEHDAYLKIDSPGLVPERGFLKIKDQPGEYRFRLMRRDANGVGVTLERTTEDDIKAAKQAANRALEISEAGRLRNSGTGGVQSETAKAVNIRDAALAVLRKRHLAKSE